MYTFAGIILIKIIFDFMEFNSYIAKELEWQPRALWLDERGTNI